MNKIPYFLILLLLTGCESIFGTREPEEPNDDVARSLWQQPTSPGIVLENLSISFLERNEENYVRCLTDSSSSERAFIYLPDQETTINFPGLFSAWGLEQERLYIKLLFSDASLPTGALSDLTFSSFEEPSIPSDTAMFEEIYDLQLEHELENVPKRVRGIARLRMARDFSGNWSIYRWEDQTYSTDDTLDLPTWSELRARAL